MYYTSNTYLHQNVDFSTYELRLIRSLLTMVTLAGELMGVKDTGKVRNLRVAKSQIVCVLIVLFKIFAPL